MVNNGRGDAWLRVAVALMLPSLLVLGACLPEPLEVRGIPKVKTEIVIATQMLPEQSLAVLVTRTFGALDASDSSDPEAVLDQIAVNDAIVTLEYGTSIDTLTFIDRGLYVSPTAQFIEGAMYTLRVESESLGSVTATTRAMPMIRFASLEAELYFDGFDDTLAQITYAIPDPDGRNWYMVNVLKIDSAELRNNLLNPRDFTRLVDDSDIYSGRLEETFRVFPREFKKGDTIAVMLSNITEEYFNFMQMRLDNRFGFFEFLSEPVNYPSNVVGGKGFFNLYIPDVRFVVLE